MLVSERHVVAGVIFGVPDEVPWVEYPEEPVTLLCALRGPFG